jgi:hypothetical protein
MMLNFIKFNGAFGCAWYHTHSERLPSQLSSDFAFLFAWFE